MQTRDLFGNYKYCDYCRKPLPVSYEKDLCPFCIEQQLFQRVKEFIRANDVNEYEVAKEFNIPLSQVKHWIREGRIEYKDQHLNAITMHCVECGTKIVFGTMCSKCTRIKNTTGFSKLDPEDPGRMRYFEED